MATGSAHVEIVVTVSTPETRRLAALEQLEEAVGHLLRHSTFRGMNRVWNELHGAYIASRETK